MNKLSEIDNGSSSPWNTLEVAKLVVAGFSSLCIAVLTGILGYSNYQLTKQNIAQEQSFKLTTAKRDADARTRQAIAEAKLRREAYDREDEIRSHNEDLALAAADLAFKRAKEAQREAHNREEALQFKAEQRAEQTQNIVRTQHLQDRMIDHRFQLWSKLGPSINSIYTYIIMVNDWKEYTPSMIVALKRSADKIVYTDGHYFTPQFLDSYDAFMNESFCVF